MIMRPGPTYLRHEVPRTINLFYGFVAKYFSDYLVSVVDIDLISTTCKFSSLLIQSSL